MNNLELLKDKDMGEKFYSELDISEHGIMLNGLPKFIACDELEGMIQTIFVELLANENIDKNQIVQIKVLSDFHKCTSWLKKLKRYQSMFEATNNVNKRNGEGAAAKKLMISKGSGLFGAKVEVDASDFYNKKIHHLKEKIRIEEK